MDKNQNKTNQQQAQQTNNQQKEKTNFVATQVSKIEKDFGALQTDLRRKEDTVIKKNLQTSTLEKGDIESTIQPKMNEAMISSNADSSQDDDNEKEDQTAQIAENQYLFKRIVEILQKTMLTKASSDIYIHAMANLMGASIDFKPVKQHIKEMMLKDFIFVLTDKDFDVEGLYRKECLKVLSKIVTTSIPIPKQMKLAEIKAQIAQVMDALHEGRINIASDLGNFTWQAMSRLTGVFLPANSLSDNARVKILVDVSKRMKKWAQVKHFDLYSLSEMAFYTGLEVRPVANGGTAWIVVPQCTDPSFSLADRRADFVTRANADLGTIILESEGKTFKDREWCGSGTKCQVDIIPAINDQCITCFKYVHPQCGSVDEENLYTCTECSTVLRQLWEPKMKKWIPLLTKTPAGSATSSPNQKSPPNKKTKVGTEDTDSSELDDVNDPQVTGEDGNNNSDLDEEFDLESILKKRADGAASAATGNMKRKKLDFDESRNETKTIEENAGTDEEDTGEGTITRFDLTLLVPEFGEDEVPEEVLWRTIKSLTSKIKTVDPGMKVLTWRENDMTNFTLNEETLIVDYDNIHIYFPRTSATSNTRSYGDVRILHHLEWRTIAQQISFWLKNNGHSLYVMKLQVENTRIAGWLQWSHRTIKADRLAEAIAKDYNIHIFFRYSTIFFEKGEKFDEENKAVKALHVVCESDDADYIKDKLKQIYHQSKTNFPFGIKMRFMPAIYQMDVETLTLMQLFRAQQEQYLATVKIAGTNSIRVLDGKTKDMKTLRNLIMNLKSRTTAQPLFLGVDPSWNNATRTIFTFGERHEKEAVAIVNTIAGYMYHFYGDKIVSYFSQESIEKGKLMEWDEKRQILITADEKYIQSLSMMDDSNYFGLDNSLLAPNFQTLLTNATSSASSTANATAGDIVTASIHEQLMQVDAAVPYNRASDIYYGNETCSLGTVATQGRKPKALTGVMEDATVDGVSVFTEDDDQSTGGIKTKKSVNAETVRRIQTEVRVMNANVTQMYSGMTAMQSTMSGFVEMQTTMAGFGILLQQLQAINPALLVPPNAPSPTAPASIALDTTEPASIPQAATETTTPVEMNTEAPEESFGDTP